MEAKRNQLTIPCPKNKRSYRKGLDYVLAIEQLRDIVPTLENPSALFKKKENRGERNTPLFESQSLVQTKMF